MIALLLVAMMCVSAFAGMRLISDLAMRNAIRTEAAQVLQNRAEQLLAGDYDSFVATTTDQTVTSILKTTFRPGNQARFAPAPGAAGRIVFTWRVVQVASTGSSRTLRLEVEWTWRGKKSALTTRLFRAM